MSAKNTAQEVSRRGRPKPGATPEAARRLARRLEGRDPEDRRLKALARRLASQ